MALLANVFSHQIVQKLGWTLVHFVWQAALVAVLLAILLRRLRKSSANLRYIIACLALGLIVLLPAATIQSVSVPAPYPTGGIEPAPAYVSVILPAARGPELSSPQAPATGRPVQTETVVVARKVSLTQRVKAVLEPVLPHMVLAWLTGVLGLSLWHLGGWTQLQRLRRKMVRPVSASFHNKLRELAELLCIRQTVQIVESGLVKVPVVIGWLRPVILLPGCALTGLSPEQMEALLAHELAHVRRYDYLVNILQTIVEILGFYHPAVWWVSHRIRVERENCCDDIAAGITGDKVRYARALTSMEEIRCGRPALAVAANGGSLFERICRIVGRDSQGDSRFNWAAPIIALLLTLALVIPAAVALTGNSTEKVGVIADTKTVWGEAVEGLQVRLSPEKQLWEVGDVCRLVLGVRNAGEKTFVYTASMQMQCEVEVDGIWYVWGTGFGDRAASRELRPGAETDEIMRVELVSSWGEKGSGECLNLGPGRHRIRVLFRTGIGPPWQNEKERVSVISNAVEVEVLQKRTGIEWVLVGREADGNGFKVTYSGASNCRREVVQDGKGQMREERILRGEDITSFRKWDSKGRMEQEHIFEDGRCARSTSYRDGVKTEEIVYAGGIRVKYVQWSGSGVLLKEDIYDEHGEPVSSKKWSAVGRPEYEALYEKGAIVRRTRYKEDGGIDESKSAEREELEAERRNWPQMNPSGPPTDKRFAGTSERELMGYILNRANDDVPLACAWFAWKTQGTSEGLKLRKQMANEIVRKVREIAKDPMKSMHDCYMWAQFLGGLGAREQIRQLLSEEKVFSCHYGPDLVESLGMCGTIEDVPALIDAIDKESEGAGAVVNRALYKITGLQMRLNKHGYTDKEAWEEWRGYQHNRDFGDWYFGRCMFDKAVERYELALSHPFSSGIDSLDGGNHEHVEGRLALLRENLDDHGGKPLALYAEAVGWGPERREERRKQLESIKRIYPGARIIDDTDFALAEGVEYTAGLEGLSQHWKKFLSEHPKSPLRHEVEKRLAFTYHNLGIKSRWAGRYDEQEKWFGLFLEQPLVTEEYKFYFTYADVGKFFEERGKLDVAEQAYKMCGESYGCPAWRFVGLFYERHYGLDKYSDFLRGRGLPEGEISRYLEEFEEQRRSSARKAAEGEIKYVMRQGSKAEVNWVISALTMENFDVRWFLQRGRKAREEEIIVETAGSDSWRGEVHRVRASPNGQYLAVERVGEGHPSVEVLDLPGLVFEGKISVLQKIEPYPGTARIDHWEGDLLVIASDALLPEMEKMREAGYDGLVLCGMPLQQYAFDIGEGRLTALSEAAKDPVGYFTRQLQVQEKRESAEAALAALAKLSVERKQGRVESGGGKTGLAVAARQSADTGQ